MEEHLGPEMSLGEELNFSLFDKIPSDKMEEFKLRRKLFTIFVSGKQAMAKGQTKSSEFDEIVKKYPEFEELHIILQSSNLSDREKSDTIRKVLMPSYQTEYMKSLNKFCTDLDEENVETVKDTVYEFATNVTNMTVTPNNIIDMLRKMVQIKLKDDKDSIDFFEEFINSPEITSVVRQFS